MLVKSAWVESLGLNMPNGAYRPCRRGFRRGGGGGVRGGNVDEQVPGVLFADDLELGQGNEERLANAKGRHAIGFIQVCLLCHNAR
jgi:hypothetical protein